jgi:hypothetical protein
MKILFLNHKIHNCGVYQYGKQIYDILNKNNKSFTYQYYEIESTDEYNYILNNCDTDVSSILYNYCNTTMSWLNETTISTNFRNICILHFGDPVFFDIVTSVDPDSILYNGCGIPRPIFENISGILNTGFLNENIKNFIEYKEYNTPIFGSFGFATRNKGFDNLVNIINEQYDKAIIKLILPFGHFAPPEQNFMENILRCNVKPDIKLMITHDFLPIQDIIKFLHSNDMNIFLYNDDNDNEISRTIDIALSVKKPLGISKSSRFRNIYSPIICLEETSIQECLNNSVKYCSKFIKKYSNGRLQKKIKKIIYSEFDSTSQAGQDLFVYKILKNKHCGTALDIGCNCIESNSNVKQLLKLGWKTLNLDIDNYNWNHIRNSNFIQCDITNINWENIIEDNDILKNKLDYISFNATLLSLTNFPWNKIRCKVITIKHDMYRIENTTKNIIINTLNKNGYKLLCENVNVFYQNSNCNFEDWWIDPTEIDNYLIDIFKAKDKLGIDIAKRIINNKLKIEISLGEAFDRYSILQIKNSEIKDIDNLVFIQKELDDLFEKIEDTIIEYQQLYTEIYNINKKIWIDTEKIRNKDEDISNILMSIHKDNEERFRIKNKINNLYKSEVRECKSYKTEPYIYIASGLLGDFIHQLYIVKKIYDMTNIKGIVILVNMEGFIDCDFKRSLSCVHSELLHLLKRQSYIENFFYDENTNIPCEFEENVINLSKWRFAYNYTCRDNDLHSRIINSIPLYKNNLPNFIDLFNAVYQLTSIEYPIKWIETDTNIDVNFKDKILLHFYIEQYNSTIILEYLDNLLSKNDCIFITCDINEYNNLPEYIKNKIKMYYIFNDLNSFYNAINNCKFFIGTQSSPITYAIATNKPCLCLIRNNYVLNLYNGIEKYTQNFYWKWENNEYTDGLEEYINHKEILTNFIGIKYRLSNNWFDDIDVNIYNKKPINYLEIGTFYGANLLSVAETYCLHSGSKLYCVDPWEDYEDYPEYKNQHSLIYNSFIHNVKNSGVQNKIVINRGYSNTEIPKFQDEFFDIIYIDGNHEPEYVLEDAVLSFRKLKKNGIMIFNDYGWGGPDLTQKGIDGFLSGYHNRIEKIGERETQIFIKKIK